MLNSRVLVAMLMAASPSGAQGVVRGVVTNDQGRRLPGAELTVAGINRTVRSDTAGEYRLVLPPGSYWMNVRALGYFVVGDSILPEKDVELIHDFTLSSFGITLDTVTTTAVHRTYISSFLRGFEERRRTGNGRYISEAEFKAAGHRRLPDFLRRVPGLAVVPGRGSAFYATASRSMRAGCLVTVYLDGMLLFDRGITRMVGPPDLTQFLTQTLAGAEFYASTATLPPQFRDRSGCGALLLWTRER